MKELNDLDVKYDAYGNVDVEYYVNLARQARAEYLSELVGDLKAWMAGHFNLQVLKVSVAKLAHH